MSDALDKLRPTLEKPIFTPLSDFEAEQLLGGGGHGPGGGVGACLAVGIACVSTGGIQAGLCLAFGGWLGGYDFIGTPPPPPTPPPTPSPTPSPSPSPTPSPTPPPPTPPPTPTRPVPPLKGGYRPAIDDFYQCGTPAGDMGELSCNHTDPCLAAGGRCKMFRVPEDAPEGTPWEPAEPPPNKLKVEKEAGYRYRCFCVKYPGAGD